MNLLTLYSALQLVLNNMPLIYVLVRGGKGREFRRVPDLGTRSLLPSRIREVAGSRYVTCDV